jgi:hypothetical protein
MNERKEHKIKEIEIERYTQKWKYNFDFISAYLSGGKWTDSGHSIIDGNRIILHFGKNRDNGIRIYMEPLFQDSELTYSSSCFSGADVGKITISAVSWPDNRRITIVFIVKKEEVIRICSDSGFMDDLFNTWNFVINMDHKIEEAMYRNTGPKASHEYYKNMKTIASRFDYTPETDLVWRSKMSVEDKVISSVVLLVLGLCTFVILISQDTFIYIMIFGSLTVVSIVLLRFRNRICKSKEHSVSSSSI